MHKIQKYSWFVISETKIQMLKLLIEQKPSISDRI